MNIPSELFAGDSSTWGDSGFKDQQGNAINFPAWTLKYVIASATALTLTAIAGTNGADFTTSITKVQSAGLAAGEYFWQAYAEKGTERITLGTGRIQIKAAAADGVSGKSQAQQDLDAVTAAIRAMSSGGAVAEYTIAGRSVKKLAMADLILLQSKLKAEVAREKKAQNVANGLGNSSNVFVRFKGK